MNTELKILYLENKTFDAKLVGLLLKKRNLLFEIRTVSTISAFENALKMFDPTIVLADQAIPSVAIYDIVTVLKKEKVTTPLVLLLESLSDELADDLLNRGVDDYVCTDRLQRLPQAMLHAKEKKRLAYKFKKVSN